MRTDMNRAASLSLGHAVHVLLVVAPTLILGGGKAIDVGLVAFATAILTAGLLESGSVAKQSVDRPIQDALAIRVAMAACFIFLGLLWLAQIERMLVGAAGKPIQYAGLVGVVAGVALRITAIRTLGDRFVSDIAIRGDVVRDGIYAWLRHPSELGFILLAFGYPLLLSAPLTAMLALLAIVPISTWRMRRENRVLLSAVQHVST